MGGSKVIRVLPIFLVVGFVFWIAYFSPNTGVNSDPRYTLLVSQAVIEHQTMRLDAYKTAVENPASVEWRLWEKEGHTHYAYPLAASVLAVPVVVLLNQLGYDMSLPGDEGFAQNLLSALIVASVFLILYQISRCYLPPLISLCIAAFSVLGTTLMSTLGTAVWSQDFAVIFICLAVWLLVRLEKNDPVPLTPYLLGWFLFLAYFSRPSTAVFIAATLLFLLFHYRRQFWGTAFTAFILLLGFALFSQKEFGLWLPPYYLPVQFGGLLAYGNEGATPLPIAIYALLFSPSRGLFVYSPIFLVAIIGLIRYWGSIKHHSLLWLIAMWTVGHVLFVARFPNWWGGFSFGPRLLTEMIPGLVLLIIFVTQAWLEDQSRRSRQIALVLFLATTISSIIIHSYVGMFSQEMLLSHGYSLPPHVDKAPYLLLDWRYPQFLTTPESACARNKAYFGRMLTEKVIAVQSYSWGQEIGAQEANKTQLIPAWAWWHKAKPQEEVAEGVTAVVPFPHHTFLPIIQRPSDPIRDLAAVFIGWGVPEKEGTWSTCHTTTILIGPVESAPPEQQVTLTLFAQGHLAQPVHIRINGANIGQMTFSENTVHQQIVFPAARLHTDQLNNISLDIPNAFTPEGTGDDRLLGIFLEKFVIYP